MALPADPFIGLEEIESENSLKWVNEQNALTVEELEKHPSYQGLYSDLEQILFADDRIPFASYYQGSFWNFWQDASHKHGILRRTTLEEYRKEQPLWDTVLDLDELSRLESENWVYKGNVRLDMNSPLGLVYLSRGGKDAVVVREFDFRRGKFVEDGFVIPEAKTSVTPLDENHLLIGTDFGPESLTDSRYPRVIKVWQRGQPLSSAQKVFEVGKPDLSAQASLIRDGAKKYVLFHRAIDFYNSETYLQVENQKLQKLSIPSSGQLLGIKNSYGVFLVKHDFISLKGVIPQNSVVRFKIEEGNLDNAEIVFSANNRQSIEDVQLYERQIYINLLDNVRSKLIKLEMNSLGQWEVAELGIPLSGEISLS
ncbi:MAG: S9 family peptidase, partial [Bdellovibrionales bacterium]|nr:S9 family peptidase [Bdellovibrionales bacterium]